MENNKTVKGFKGFDKNMKCRDFQFEPGKEYTHDGPVRVCESGFHFCENPLDIFTHYAPADCKFYEVEASGEMDGEKEDSKISCSRLKIGEEVNLPTIIQAGVKFVFDRAKWSKEPAASATGYSGAASATGASGAASATGSRGAASATGINSVACGLGYDCRAKGVLGVWLVLAERTDEWVIKSIESTKVDGNKIKADTWYKLVDGKFTEEK